MEKKSFFKSQIFKCIFVLFIITIVSGGLLAVLNDLLFVSEEETLNRAIKKIYGQEMTATIENDEGISCEGDIATINKIYSLEDGNKLFNVTGTQGYKGGTITLWVVVKYENDAPIKIEKVVLDTYDKQTRMGDFKSSYYNSFTEISLEDIKNGKDFTADSKNTTDIKNVVTGATVTSNAACNAINGIIQYIWGK